MCNLSPYLVKVDATTKSGTALYLATSVCQADALTIPQLWHFELFTLLVKIHYITIDFIFFNYEFIFQGFIIFYRKPAIC